LPLVLFYRWARHTRYRSKMPRMRPLPPTFAFVTILALVRSEGWTQRDSSAGAALREYALGAQSMSFYRPHQLQITGVGLINEETAYFSTRGGVSELQQGHLKRLPVEVGDAEISAFHLCHHRSSFFFEVRARDGSTVTIFEHSLLFEKQLQVWHQEDASPATSLACVDKLLLRASSSNLLAIDVESAESDQEPAAVSVLFEYDPLHGDANVITSLATGYAADVYERAQVYALVPHNRTLLMLHLETDHEAGKVVAETEPLLSGGDGSDGPVGEASTLEPLHLASVHDAVLFVDGCSLRQISHGHVRTLLGTPTDCSAPHNETLEPVPWASRLSKPEALAGSAEETLHGTTLMLTGADVIGVSQREDECGRHANLEDCSAELGCAWAEGARAGEQLCFGCDGLHQWAAAQATATDPCLLELSPRASTTYSLAGCGCIMPTTAPDPNSEDGAGLTALQIILGGSVIIAAACCVLMFKRASRRQAVMCELYGPDSCEFHVFTDEEQS